MKSLVLVVEDDRDILESLAELLATDGYDVATARDGAAALAMLRAISRRPAVILLDLMMPVMSGWEFREHQRKDEQLASIPVVLLSGTPDVATSAVSLAAAGWISKPVSPASLRAAVSRFASPGAARV